MCIMIFRFSTFWSWYYESDLLNCSAILCCCAWQLICCHHSFGLCTAFRVLFSSDAALTVIYSLRSWNQSARRECFVVIPLITVLVGGKLNQSEFRWVDPTSMSHPTSKIIINLTPGHGRLLRTWIRGWAGGYARHGRHRYWYITDPNLDVNAWLNR